MIKTNFHTHTFRCGHAVGDEQEIVQAAIAANISKLGFSDHVPLPNFRGFLLKGLHSVALSPRGLKTLASNFIFNGPGMRMDYASRTIHQDNVRQLKENHAHQIEIFQGYEAEYFEGYLDYYQELLDNDVDYLILGNHFNSYNSTSCYYGKEKVNDQELYSYCDDVIKALETNLFSYLAHPDLFMIGKVVFDDVAREITYDICKKAKELNIPLEINGGGIRRGKREVLGRYEYPYPSSHFFAIAGEVGNDIILGIDAHAPDELNHGIYEEMLEFASRFDLNIVTEFEFRKGQR
ncbi:MAG: histidinol-phosphatase [Erysipelotrichaceae bacterium]|nr:histidinol-phosphatase [Erysipelotrichaceae bacterium]